MRPPKKEKIGRKRTPGLRIPEMSGMHKRAVETDKEKTYQRTDRVTVLGLVCEKMADRVALARQEGEDRRVRQEV
jgi:hypothetical protein